MTRSLPKFFQMRRRISFQPRAGTSDGAVADLPRPRWAAIEPCGCAPAGINAWPTRERRKLAAAPIRRHLAGSRAFDSRPAWHKASSVAGVRLSRFQIDL
jgi:hypothetical protein